MDISISYNFFVFLNINNRELKLTRRRRLCPHGLKKKKGISLSTFSFAVTKNNFLPVNLPMYKTFGGLSLLFASEFSKENDKTWKKLISRSRCCFAEDGQKPTRLYIARAVSLFCLLTLLFGDVVHDVAFEVFLNSLIFLKLTKWETWNEKKHR